MLLGQVEPQPADLALRGRQQVHRCRLPDAAGEFSVDRVVDERQDERFEPVLLRGDGHLHRDRVEERPPVLAVIGHELLVLFRLRPAHLGHEAFDTRRQALDPTVLRAHPGHAVGRQRVGAAVGVRKLALAEHARRALGLGQLLQRLRGPTVLGAEQQRRVPDHPQVVVHQNPPPLGQLELRAGQVTDERIREIHETVLVGTAGHPGADVLELGRLAQPPGRLAVGGLASDRFEHPLERDKRVAANVQVRPRAGRVHVRRAVRGRAVRVGDTDMLALFGFATLGRVREGGEGRDVLSVDEQGDVAPFGQERVAPGDPDRLDSELVDLLGCEPGETELFLDAVGGEL